MVVVVVMVVGGERERERLEPDFYMVADVQVVATKKASQTQTTEEHVKTIVVSAECGNHSISNTCAEYDLFARTAWINSQSSERRNCPCFLFIPAFLTTVLPGPTKLM